MATATTAPVGTVITGNAELVELPHGTVLIDTEGDLFRVVKVTLTEKPHVMVITRTGHVTRFPLDTLKPEVTYADRPCTVIA